MVTSKNKIFHYSKPQFTPNRIIISKVSPTTLDLTLQTSDSDTKFPKKLFAKQNEISTLTHKSFEELFTPN